MMPDINHAILDSTDLVDWDGKVEVKPTAHGYDGLFCKKDQSVPRNTTIGFFCGHILLMKEKYSPRALSDNCYNVSLQSPCVVKIYDVDQTKRTYTHKMIVYGHGQRIPFNGQLVNHTCHKDDLNCHILESEPVECKRVVNIPRYGEKICKVKVPFAFVQTVKRVPPGAEFLNSYGNEMVIPRPLSDKWKPCMCRACGGTGKFIQV